MNPIVTFLSGMAGASAPEVVRPYAIRQSPRKFRWSWFYVLVSLMFVALGRVVALALPATALYIGASTPVLITTVARKGRETARSELRGSARHPRSGTSAYLYGVRR